MKKNRTVLIVDDEADFLSSMRRALRKEPYYALFAETAFSAIEMVESNDVDLIVSDYMMPEMNGLELLRHLHRHQPHIVSIMLTAVSEIDIAIRAVNEIGIYKFFLKPIEINALKQILRRAVNASITGSDRQRSLQRSRSRDALIEELEREFPGISNVRRDDDGFCILE